MSYERHMADGKFIYEFRITQSDGTSVHWQGCSTISKIRNIIEGELKKLE